MKAKRTFFALLLVTTLALLAGCGNTPMHAKIVDVATGDYHAMAITEDRDLYVWGSNYQGELGIKQDFPYGSADKLIVSCVPKPTLILHDIQYACASRMSTVVLDKNGELYAMGMAMDDIRPDEDRYHPRKLASNIKRAAVCKLCTMAVTTDGNLLAWGDTIAGQLNYLENEKGAGPVSNIKLMSGVKNIALGDNHALALMENGDVYAWGWKGFGQIGNGTTAEREEEYKLYPPVKVLSGVKCIAATYNVSAALTENGDLYVWGYILTKQKTNGEDDDSLPYSTLTPTKIMEHIKSISLSMNHYAAVTESGDLYLWGMNDCGQLCNGLISGRNQPEPVLAARGVRKATAGLDFTIILKEDGRVYTCGGNDMGQLGNGSCGDRDFGGKTNSFTIFPQLIFDGKDI